MLHEVIDPKEPESSLHGKWMRKVNDNSRNNLDAGALQPWWEAIKGTVFCRSGKTSFPRLKCLNHIKLEGTR